MAPTLIFIHYTLVIICTLDISLGKSLQNSSDSHEFKVNNISSSNGTTKLAKLSKSFNINLDLTSSKNSDSSLIKLQDSVQLSNYGEPCRTSADCALQFGLVCANGTCRCSPDFIARLSVVSSGGAGSTSGGRFFTGSSSGSFLKRTECLLRAGSKCDQRDLTIMMTPTSKTSSAASFRSISNIWRKIRKSVKNIGNEISNFDFGTSSATSTGIGIGGSRNSNDHCVENAVCFQGICTCTPRHYRDFRGLCLRKRGASQPCDSDDQCLSSEGLYCDKDNSTCQCRNSLTYDLVSKACLVPVGGECDAYSEPREDSRGNGNFQDCVKNSECSNGRCICLDGFTATSNGACGVAHGGFCDNLEYLCSDTQLTCRSSRCQCRYPVHQIYNETMKQCVSKPDGPCTPSPNYNSHNHKSFNYNYNSKIHCVPFAECRRNSGEGLEQTESMFEHTCKCIRNFAEDSTGSCVPSYNSDCYDDDDCDPVGQLTCVNGKCSCPDEMLVWDGTRRKCVGVFNARCRFIQLERILSLRMDIPTECIENAHCVEHVTGLDGRCECMEGFHFSKYEIKCISHK